jgi:adenine phosphoribosyltransferase
MDLKQHIRNIPDFPKPGILFYDISPLLADAGAWRETMDRMVEAIRPYQPDLLAGMESRGFLPAAPLAMALGLGFIMVRKKGKLPGETIGHSYDLEYGSDHVEVQTGAVQPGQRIVVLDDLLATGGTMNAAVSLLRKVGGEVVATSVIIELGFLGGAQRLDVPVHSVIKYDE